jgi:hypothetical protein
MSTYIQTTFDRREESMNDDNWKGFNLYDATGIERVVSKYFFQLWPQTSVKIKVLERKDDFSAWVNARKPGQSWIIVYGPSEQAVVDKALYALREMFTGQPEPIEWYDFRQF